jgi:hypothetical protein
MKICVLRMKIRFQNYSIMCVYSAMENEGVVDKDGFYEQLEKTNIQGATTEFLEWPHESKTCLSLH